MIVVNFLFGARSDWNNIHILHGSFLAQLRCDQSDLYFHEAAPTGGGRLPGRFLGLTNALQSGPSGSAAGTAATVDWADFEERAALAPAAPDVACFIALPNSSTI